MPTDIRQLTKAGEQFYPQTHLAALVGYGAHGEAIDEEPTDDSHNLVESGGVFLSLFKSEFGNDCTIGKKLGTEEEDYAEIEDLDYFITPFFEVDTIEGDYTLTWVWGRNVSSNLRLVVYDENRDPIAGWSSIGTERDVRISFADGYKYYRASFFLVDRTNVSIFDHVKEEYSFLPSVHAYEKSVEYTNNKDNVPTFGSTRAVTSEGILVNTVKQLFVSNNDGRIVEVYSDALDSNYKYYFKYFRWYDNKVQARLYKYTQSDKSDETQVGLESIVISENIIKLTGPGNTYIVHTVSADNYTENMQMELNLPNCSTLELCPNVQGYLNNEKIKDITWGDGWELHKAFLADGTETYNHDTAISPYFEVNQISGDYILDWNWGYIGALLYLTVYDEDKNFLGAFSSSPATGTSRAARISYHTGYKYYRVSVNINHLPDTHVFDNQLGCDTVAFTPISDLLMVIQKANAIDDDLIVFPSVTYLLKGMENSIYHRNYLKYEKDDFFLSPVINFMNNGWKFLERCLRVEDSAVNSLGINVVDTKTCKVKKTVTLNCQFGNADVTTPKKVNCIGDSFTYNGGWFQHIADSVQGLTFVGMRHSYQTDATLRAEGRGGWNLNSYFAPHGDVTPTHMQPFSPFMHIDGYTYYGVIDFWKVIVNGDSEYTYGTDGFDDYVSWFDSNGYKLNPSVNDLMYNGARNKYVYYNGSSWVDFNGELDFAFDYAKYLSTWNINTPDIVIIMLGKNDFQYLYSDTLFSDWEDKMNTVIESIHDFDSSIVIGICTPTVANDSPNNSDNNSAKLGARYMWLARKAIIDAFDTDAFKNQNVFVVDCGVCLDPLYGFSMREFKPFEFYRGNERELISTNGVHPSYAGYKQIGTCVAGFIQAVR